MSTKPDLAQQAATMANELERLIVWDEVVSLAYTERTGLELQPGGPYTQKDAERAAEIYALYVWSSS